MPNRSATTRVKLPDTATQPSAPTNLRLSTAMVPNPQSTQAQVTWDAAVVPLGATAVTSYNIYINGTYRRNVLPTNTNPILTGLTASTPYVINVSAVNASGESAQSIALNFTTTGAPTTPVIPTGFATTGKTSSSVSFSWTAVAGATGYRVYNGSDATADATTASTTATISSLSPSTSYSFTVTAYNTVGESARSTAVTVTTDAATVVATVMRADDIMNYSGMNVKASYNFSSYDRGTTANKQAVIDYGKGTGMRIYRENLKSTSADARNAQLDFHRALYAATGCKYHLTVGIMRKVGLTAPDIPNMTEAELRVHASGEVLDTLDALVTYWKTDVDLANGGDLSTVIHSIAGPNEIEEQKETGANWARNARIWQEQLWRGMREGKFWSATANAGAGGFVATRVGSGTGLAARDFRSLFANIPVASPSTRTDLTLTTAETAAGPIINTTTGEREITQWVEMGNVHMYQIGRSPTRGIESMLDAYKPLVKNPGHPTVPFIFSETGYNHMGWDLDGSDASPSSTFVGNVKVPPWVEATYTPRAIADYASRRIPYVRFELLDNDHSAGWDIQSFFGIVWTPTNTVDHPTTPWVGTPSYFALRRMYNLLVDRADATIPASHSTTAPQFSITNRGGAGTNLLDLLGQKSDGSYWLLLWRNVDVFTATSGGNTGTAVNVPDVNITLTFTHTTGTKTIDMWQPNKAVWDGVAGSTKSIGHGTSATWATIPTGETTWTVAGTASTKTIQVPVGPNLKILRIV